MTTKTLGCFFCGSEVQNVPTAAQLVTCWPCVRAEREAHGAMEALPLLQRARDAEALAVALAARVVDLQQKLAKAQAALLRASCTDMGNDWYRWDLP